MSQYDTFYQIAPALLEAKLLQREAFAKNKDTAYDIKKLQCDEELPVMFQPRMEMVVDRPGFEIVVVWLAGTTEMFDG